jgi:hypothetical protein
MLRRLRIRIALGALWASVLAISSVGVAFGAANGEANCVGLASSFFAGDQARDDVAHAIKLGFGIPPGAEVSRFARVQLGDLEACLIDGQG